MIAICHFCDCDVDTLENPKAGHKEECPIKIMKKHGMSELEIHSIIQKIREIDNKKNK